ncbi:hypothetical protein HQ545_02245 [Candidatus Woesearchaeota archaeon]|nr:hypothetical protein [Candidatus Woesearchaeota archaeon]
MELDPMTVVINLDENYHKPEDLVGSLERLIQPEEVSAVMNGTFRGLVKYVVKDCSGLDDYQKRNRESILSLLDNQEGISVRMNLYEDGNPIQSEDGILCTTPDDIVMDCLYDRMDMLEIGLYGTSVVG